MGERNKGIIIFLIYIVLFTIWYFKMVRYMEYIIFIYYIIQFGLSVFIANNKIDQIIKKGTQ